MPKHNIGTLVHARGREWVVLPDSDDDFLHLQPVSGANREVAGLLTGLEPVTSAAFPLPDPAALGDISDWQLIRDAFRLGFRSSIGPFRSLAEINVMPRSYQLVPLLMALKLDPVRILIGDDVGVGKTIEALLIAKELLAQGSIKRLAVLCSPALAEQWQSEMRDKFGIEAELVLSSTATKLEQRCTFGQSLFERYPFVVVSTEFIKSDRRREDFYSQAPELIIIDEAHSSAGGSNKTETQRFELVSNLAKDPDRHVILLTATPHSGKSEGFHNLLSLLDKQFAELPNDLSGKENEHHRRHLAQHFIQRRRSDIRQYIGEDTPFPTRHVAEESYLLDPDYKRLIVNIVLWAHRKLVDENGQAQKRVRYWSLLALLRSLVSSPEAAVSTLRNRASNTDASTTTEADASIRTALLDLDSDAVTQDGVIGGDISAIDSDAHSAHRYFQSKANEIEASFMGPGKDLKLSQLIKMVKQLTSDGFSPIIFCRFIPTATYVSRHLKEALGKSVAVDSVTGELPAEERQARVVTLGDTGDNRVLVATDCLSEGVNLQDHFDAVIHYDLSWNPTRHEQREGRVDRYGQPSDTVRAITFFGADNGIDQIVLDVLIRKSRAIREATGVAVPAPSSALASIEDLLKKIIQNKEFGDTDQLSFDLSEGGGLAEELTMEWDDASEREKRSRHMFAQYSIKPDDVQAEVERVHQTLGTQENLYSFLLAALPALGGKVIDDDGVLRIDLSDAGQDLVGAVPRRLTEFSARVELPVREGEVYLMRTHPFVETVAARIVDAALNPTSGNHVPRSGAAEAEARNIVYLVQHRIKLVRSQEGENAISLSEHLEYLSSDHLGGALTPQTDQKIEKMLNDGGLISLDRELAIQLVADAVSETGQSQAEFLERSQAISVRLKNDHNRVRDAAKQTGLRITTEPACPPQILAIYVLNEVSS